LKFVVGFFIGAVIGAGIAVAIGPGDASKLPSGVADLLDRGKAILENAIDEGRRVAEDQRASLESQVTS
jgi:gas vesicle protein